jgi:hypothetical protein
MKKPLILFAAICFLIFGGSCATYALHSGELLGTTKNKYSTFTEAISTFLITADGKQLIVVGKNHHYFFTADDTLKFILTWSEKKRIKAAFSDFIIDDDQNVSGSYSLTIDTTQDLPPETRDLLISKGFTSNPSKSQLLYHHTIQGTRYFAGDFKLPVPLELNQKYMITMHEDYDNGSSTDIMERILLTPLTIALDGALVAAGVAAMVVGFPALIYTVIER